MTPASLATWLQHWRAERDEIYVDVEDFIRKRRIREAELQAAIEAESEVVAVVAERDTCVGRAIVRREME